MKYPYQIKWVAPEGRVMVVPLPIIYAKNKASAIREARRRTSKRAILSVKRIKLKNVNRY